MTRAPKALSILMIVAQLFGTVAFAFSVYWDEWDTVFLGRTRFSLLSNQEAVGFLGPYRSRKLLHSSPSAEGIAWSDGFSPIDVVDFIIVSKKNNSSFYNDGLDKSAIETRLNIVRALIPAGAVTSAVAGAASFGGLTRVPGRRWPLLASLFAFLSLSCTCASVNLWLFMGYGFKGGYWFCEFFSTTECRTVWGRAYWTVLVGGGWQLVTLVLGLVTLCCNCPSIGSPRPLTQPFDDESIRTMSAEESNAMACAEDNGLWEVPEGDWTYDKLSGMHWSDDYALYFHRGSGHYYCPDRNQWYDAEADHWDNAPPQLLLVQSQNEPQRIYIANPKSPQQIYLQSPPQRRLRRTQLVAAGELNRMPPEPPGARRINDKNVTGERLENCVCNSIKLTSVKLVNCHVTDCTLDDCAMEGGWYCSCRIKEGVFDDAKIVLRSVLDDSTGKRTHLTNCQIQEGSFQHCHMIDCNVADSIIKHNEAVRCKFTRCKLRTNNYTLCEKNQCDN